MVTLPYKVVGLEGMSDYSGIRVQRFHCTVNVEVGTGIV